MLVTERAEVAAIALAIERASLVAFDLEFVSADRLVPALCLLQVAWLDAGRPDAVAEIRMLDPIAVDVTPAIHALARHPLVVAHAPRQDLGLIATRYGVDVGGIVDTQLMAAFAGMGDQLGLATLVGELAGVTLGKQMQWTDWSARPLSDAQLAYAAADVHHLPELYRKLAARLGDRLAWVREESVAIVAAAREAAAVTPETAWQHVGGARGLDAAESAALVALAAWRQRVAIELDRPLGQVMNDKVLVELARERPGSGSEVRATKGLSQHARSRSDDIARAIADAPPAPAAMRPVGRAPSLRAQRWAEMLLAIAHVIAEDTQIAPRLIATRADAEDFARTVDDHGLAAAGPLPALATWRRGVLGTAWEGWLAGRVAVVGDATAPHGIRLVTR